MTNQNISFNFLFHLTIRKISIQYLDSDKLDKIRLGNFVRREINLFI